VFCSPPYAFYHERQQDMLDLIGRIELHAPPGSILLVEADEQFDFELLRVADSARDDHKWDVRSYSPARVGLWRK
jgi:16S rRNA (guanine966-N2)-methyltransferase